MATSCLKDNDASPNLPKTALRLVNAYSYAESIVFADENNYITPPAVPLRYSEYTRDLAVLYPGNKRIKVYDNMNKLVSDTTLNLKDSSYYTSFVFGNTEKAKNLIAKDIALNNLGNNAGIRFLHLANNIGNVSVHFNTITNTIYPNRAPELLSAAENPNTLFTAETSGKQKIIITDANANILVEREHEFIKSHYYSIILIGDKNSTSKPLYLGIIQQ